tara:strand:- start:288 stop:992 length:705 start_codon:yes stop_codon:yes gene_type:complete
MFSIIIPTLNEEKMIEKTINQFDNVRDIYNLEFIVSDSNSCDRTVDISKKSADKVVIHKSNSCNISKVRNLGATKASHDLLVFLDADIIVNDSEMFIKNLLDIFANKDIVAVSPRIQVDPKLENLSDKYIHRLISLISNIMNFFGFGYSRGGCQVVRSDVFKKINGYNENYIAGEDVDLFRKISKIGKTMIANNITVYESPRRYRKFGYINVLFNWFMNWFYTLLFKKSFSTKW